MLNHSDKVGPRSTAAAVIALSAALAGCGASDRGSEPATPEIRVVAVLPLAERAAPADGDYFASGMTDELIGALSRISAWRVISRASVMPYAGAGKPLPVIARELGVDAIVEGSMQRSDDRVQMTVRLVPADGDAEPLWSQSYDRVIGDVLDVQADIARSIAAGIGLPLTPLEQERLAARGPVDPGLLELYLRGKIAVDPGTEDAFRQAIDYFDQALERNPAFAPAHAALALAYGALNPAYQAPHEVMPQSREHALKAIALDETLPDAHMALASVLFRYDWDWAGTRREITRAIELNPSSADAHELYGNYLTAVGQDGQAIAELRAAHELNPTSLVTYSSLLGSLVTSRQYDAAIDESRQALAEHPDFGFAAAWLGMALVMKGELAEALPVLERARELDDNPTTVHFLAMAHAAAGNRAEAEQLATALAAAAQERYTCAYEVGSVYLRLGDTQKALDWLGRCEVEKCDCMVWLKTEPWMDPLRVDPRYRDLIARLAFPEGPPRD